MVKEVCVETGIAFRGKRGLFMGDYMKAMKFQYHERIPIRVSLLPAIWMKHAEELEDILFVFS